MDVSLTPTQTHTSNTTTTTTTTTTTGSTKSPEPDPDPDPDTPTRAVQPVKPSHFSNGVLKRHNSLGHPPATLAAYKECLRNHAASLGGHALDGCLEFMSSPTSTASDPTSLKCAACGCHRNFHRREPEHPMTSPPPRLPAIEYQPLHRHQPPPPPPPQPLHPPAPPWSPSSASPPPISSHPPSSAPHMLLALSAAPESSVPPPQGLVSPLSGVGGLARKRFRTKFSQIQKERMLKFAERVAWRMQKRDDDVIREFCNEVGVDRSVFKVWMHNNKNTFGKPRVIVVDHFDDNPNGRNPTTKSANPVNNEDSPMNAVDGTGGSMTQDLFRIHHHHHNDHQQQQTTGTNGSSSSS